MQEIENMPVNLWFPKTRITIVKFLADWLVPPGEGVSIFYFTSLPKDRWSVWYGFGTDWKGILLLICSRLFYWRSGDWWKVHSVVVNEKTGRYYHLTDDGAESGDNVMNLCVYPLDFDITVLPPSDEVIEKRHNLAVESGAKVRWTDAFLWALGLKDDVFLCHHYALSLLSTRDENKTTKDLQLP